jgi:septal ring factor EnvC (AmiA/AmiB activator)
VEPLRRPDDFPAIFAVHHHLESYRPGPEAAVARLERRLHEAQREIEALETDQQRLRELNEKVNVERVKEHTKRQRAEAQLERATQKLERLEQKSAARRLRAAPPEAAPSEGVSAGAPVR